MPRHFSGTTPHVGQLLPKNTYGKLVATFESSSPIPLRGGANTGRHIYLALKVPDGASPAGIFECAVNIRSDEGTEVLFAERIESDPGPVDPGFTQGVHLSYGTAAGDPNDSIGLKDEDFAPIENDELYDRIRDLASSCDAVSVHGVTYSGGDGLHDVHMNSGTDPSDAHARDDRDREDGAIAFYFDLVSGQDRKRYAHWIFVRFDSQTIA